MKLTQETPAPGAPWPISPADLCHPSIRRTPFTADGWIFELKHDGYRAFVRKTGTRIDLLSRWARSMAAAFPEVIEALGTLEADMVLDAELVVPDPNGRSDFAELRRRALLQRPRLIDHAAAIAPAVLIVFDALHAAGRDLRPLPLSERRAWLRAHVKPRPRIQLIDEVPAHGEALFAVITEHDQEGIVGKRLDSRYGRGKQPAWVKIKNRNYSRRDAVEWHQRQRR